MTQIDFGFLSNILGLLLAILSILLTILITLIGYFVSKFNSLIDSVDYISSELKTLNDTNKRVEENLAGISTTVVRIEERTRQNADSDSMSSDGGLLFEKESESYFLKIAFLSTSNKIFGESYESIIQEANELVDNIQLTAEYYDAEEFEADGQIQKKFIQSGIWILSPEVFQNDEIRRELRKLEPVSEFAEIFVPLESGYQKKEIKEIVHSMDGATVESKEALIAFLQAYFEIFDDIGERSAHEIWRTKLSEIEGVEKV